MPFLVFVAAGYAAYVANEKAEAAKYDEDINLEGKTAIPLMIMEQKLSILETPITTINFLDGNYKDVVPYLENRVNEIIKKNPWLAGWLIRDIHDDLKVKIYFDESGEDGCKGHFKAFEPFVIPLSRELSYKDYSKLLGAMDVLVPVSAALIGKNKPFWRVTVVPDAEAPEERFALVVSMAHAVGDAITFYMLFNMLDQEKLILPLDAWRISDYRDQLIRQIGEVEVDYIRHAVSQPLVDLTGTSDDRAVFKLFFVDEDWVLEHKGRRQSVFQPDVLNGRSASVVSGNSILTSWFFNLNAASIGLLVVDLRSRIEGCAVGNTNAGNYVHTLPYTPSDYGTPGLIQESVKRLKRCGPGASEDLPKFGWDMTASMLVNWSNHNRDDIYLNDNVKTQLHLPLVDSNFLERIPNRTSCLILFTAHPTGIDGSERRLGAMVICRQTVWEKLQTTGIVEEMIADL